MKNLVLLLIGVALGVGGTVLAPPYIAPYLPARFGQATSVDGTVTAKRQEADRLLLTIETARGRVLATFTKKVPEISLLVGQGDRIQLALGTYTPFVDDPTIRAVHSQEPAAPTSPPPAEAPLTSAAPERPAAPAEGTTIPAEIERLEVSLQQTALAVSNGDFAAAANHLEATKSTCSGFRAAVVEKSGGGELVGQLEANLDAQTTAIEVRDRGAATAAVTQGLEIVSALKKLFWP